MPAFSAYGAWGGDVSGRVSVRQGIEGRKDKRGGGKGVAIEVPEGTTIEVPETVMAVPV